MRASPGARPSRLALLLLLLSVAGCGRPAAGPPSSDQPRTIANKGSDTMVNLALAWAEAYQPDHPEVLISVTGGGSGTGLAALINGTVDIANASRQIKPEELAEAEANGIEPVEFVVARDAIAVIVHPDNPIDRLTLEQISAIYSGAVNNWSQVGGDDRPIIRLSRESNSGTYVYFLEQVVRLGKKDDPTLFSPDTLLLPSSQGIAAELAYDVNAIGYDGLGYVTDAMKVVAVGARPEGPFVLPSVETVNNRAYPIARDLYMYTPGRPQADVRSYLDWILSPAGQAYVLSLGFVPLKP